MSSHTPAHRGSAPLPHVKSHDIVISGSSASGLALALALSHETRGELAIALIDRLPAPGSATADVRAFALSAASRHMLERLGVWPDIADEAQEVRRIDITDSALEAGIRPIVLTYDNLVDHAEPATHIVPEQSVVRALRHHVTKWPAIQQFHEQEITSTHAGPSVITIERRGSGPLSSSLLVCAEGRQSALRERAGIKIVGWGYGQIGIVVRVAHERPHESTAVQHFLPAGPFAILPLPGNRSCITWTEDETNARRILAMDDTAFLAEVECRFGGRLGAISLDSERQSWPLAMHLARSYVAPRFALVGDAAHGVHPLAGQGLNLALKDAAALSEVIVETARLGLDIGSSTVLQRYERWRRFDSAVSAAAFDGLNRLFSNDNAFVRAMRDAGLGIVDRTPGLKTFFVKEAAGLSGETPRLLRGEAI